MKRRTNKPEQPGAGRKKPDAGLAGTIAEDHGAEGVAQAVEAEVIPPPARRGRPSKRTPELERQIAECFRLGMSIPQVCDACGISQTQFRNWRKHYRDFQDLIRRAEAEAVRLNLSVIQAAAASGKSWQAAAWFLERKHPEQWAKTESLTVEARKDAVKEAIRIGPARPPEHLRELRAALQLPASAEPELVEAALEHAKGERLRKAQAEIFGTPYTPQPFEGIPKEKRGGLTGETLARIDRLFLGAPEPSRADKIAALMQLQAKARELTGRPPLPEAEAFEAAARELDHADSGGAAGG